MTRHLSWTVYREGTSDLDLVRSIKDSARFSMGVIDPSLGDIPDWNENPEAFAAYQEISVAARGLERALMNLLAVYERQEMSESPEDWEFASSRRSA